MRMWIYIGAVLTSSGKKMTHWLELVFDPSLRGFLKCLTSIRFFSLEHFLGHGVLLSLKASFESKAHEFLHGIKVLGFLR
jgi:hypothetical protein